MTLKFILNTVKLRQGGEVQAALLSILIGLKMKKLAKICLSLILIWIIIIIILKIGALIFLATIATKS